MLKKKCLVLFFFLVCATAGAQVSVDIFDPFYDDLVYWENVGIINDAPNVLPLPLQEVERILDIVKEFGNERDRKLAQEHYERFFERFIHAGATLDLGFRFGGGGNDFFVNGAPLVDINYKLDEYFSVGAQFLLDLTNKMPKDETNPKFLTSKRDISSDDATIGKMSVLPSFNSGVTVGTSEYYFSANISRIQYGVNRELGIFASSNATKSANFTLSVNKPFFVANVSLLSLASTDDFGKNLSPNKYLAIHSLEIRPLSWLTFGYIESVVFGGRFEPLYLVPFSCYFVSQGLVDFADNSLIGFDFSIKPIDGLRFTGEIFFDDIAFNELIQFKEHRARLSGEFGVSYSMPEKHWFRSVMFDYTFATPYAYTHITNEKSDKVNYENYTHNGTNLGTNLEPNSDRFMLKAEFEPIDPLRITLSNVLVRHANVNESVTDTRFLVKYMTEDYNTDGSVLNHAAVWNGEIRKDTILYSNPFLKQSVVNYVYQLSLDVSCRLPIRRSGGHMNFMFGYCFEADINPGVSNRMFYKSAISEKWAGADWSEIGAGSFTVDGQTFTSADVMAERDRQFDEWKSKATGKKFNHYLKLGASFAY